MKGKKHSLEARQKMSAAHAGKPHNPEWVRKQAESSSRTKLAQQRKMGAAQKAQLSLRMRGNQYTKGRIIPPEEAARSAARLALYRDKACAAASPFVIARNKSDEQKAKVRAAWARRTAEERRAITRNGTIASRSAKPTSIERAVRTFLRTRGVPFKFQHPLGAYIVDFFLSEKAIVIECDGTYWHSLPECIVKDAQRDLWLTAQGYQVIRLPETLIRSRDFHCLEGIF